MSSTLDVEKMGLTLNVESVYYSYNVVVAFMQPAMAV